jgi:hypothetical protein
MMTNLGVYEEETAAADDETISPPLVLSRGAPGNCLIDRKCKVQALEEVLEISPQGNDRSGSNNGASFRCGITTPSDINSQNPDSESDSDGAQEYYTSDEKTCGHFPLATSSDDVHY